MKVLERYDLHSVAEVINAQNILLNRLSEIKSEFPVQVYTAREIVGGPGLKTDRRLSENESHLLGTQGLSRSRAEAQAFWKAHFLLVRLKRLSSGEWFCESSTNELAESVFATIENHDWGFKQ